MTDSRGHLGAPAAGTPDPAEGTADPFVRQVAWLIAAVGGKDQLVARSGNRVSPRTLDNWAAGVYPRHKVTGAVRDLDAWAAEHVPGYPAAAGVPRLTESCGPHRGSGPVAAAEPAGADAGVTVPERGDPRPRRSWVRPALVAGALVLVAAVAIVVTVLVVRRDDARTMARASAASSSAAEAAARSLARLPLPSTGDGTLRPEQAGSIGANTFSDPRTLTDRALPIPPHTTVMVRCRYYAPSVPSVTPDGFWYLIDDGQWAGRWSPANSYMNGDVPGGPTLHNTDLAVPVCR